MRHAPTPASDTLAPYRCKRDIDITLGGLRLAGATAFLERSSVLSQTGFLSTGSCYHDNGLGDGS